MPIVENALSFVNLDTLRAEVQLHGAIVGGSGPELINGGGSSTKA